MSDLYPREARNLDVIGHLDELRRRILICLEFLFVASIISFIKGKALMWLAKRPADTLIGNLIFITPTEVFVSYVKVSFLVGFILSFPVILYQLWLFLAPAVAERKRKHIVLWMGLALICFFAGILFSYFVAVPAALKFLLNFGKGIAVPAITLSKYISFFGALILIGGTIFEIPIILGLLTDIGLLESRILRAKRQYAVIIILIVAAVITPTQDIANLLIFSLPMILLYEIGILISKIVERRKKSKK